MRDIAGWDRTMMNRFSERRPSPRRTGGVNTVRWMAAAVVLAGALLTPAPAAAQQGCAEMRQRMNEAIIYARRGHNPQAQYAAAQNYRTAIQAYCTGGNRSSSSGGGGSRGVELLYGALGIVSLLSEWAEEDNQQAEQYQNQMRAYEQRQQQEQARLQAEAARVWQEEALRRAEIATRKAEEEALRVEQERIAAGRRNVIFEKCDAFEKEKFPLACKAADNGPFGGQSAEQAFADYRSNRDALWWDSVTQQRCTEINLGRNECIPDDFRRTIKSLTGKSAIHIAIPNEPDYMAQVLTEDDYKRIAAGENWQDIRADKIVSALEKRVQAIREGTQGRGGGG